jgi:hypothetical protein
LTEIPAPQAGPAWPGGQQSPADDPYALAPVLVGFAGPARQRRATVLVRLILAVPHLTVLAFIGVVSFVIAVAGWCLALVTGRLPQFAGEYLTGFLRWQTRVTAYLLLLTDAYPPFSFGDADYPVRLYTKPVRLNRAAVAFRLILVLPAALINLLTAAGLLLWSVVNWLIVLVGGRIPASLYQAIAAAVRFNARYNGYALLLTAQYPTGLLGDRPANQEPASQEPANPEPASQEPADPWILVLTGRAKVIVAACLASGVLLTAGYIAAVAGLAANDASQAGAASGSIRPSPAVPPGSSHSPATTLVKLHQAYVALQQAVDTADAAAARCGGDHHCIGLELDNIGSDFSAFSAGVENALEGIHVPAGAASAAGDLEYQASQATVEFAVLGQATSSKQFQREFKTGGAAQTLNQMGADFAALVGALSQRAGAD